MMSNTEFEAFVKRELGDIAVMDEGRYISPKIQKYWLTWCAAMERAAQICDGIHDREYLAQTQGWAVTDDIKHVAMECACAIRAEMSKEPQ